MLAPILTVLSRLQSNVTRTGQWETELAEIEKEHHILDLLKQMLPTDRLNFVVDGDVTYYLGPRRMWYAAQTQLFFQRLFEAISEAVNAESQRTMAHLKKLITDSSQVWSYQQFRERFPERFGEAATFSGPFPHSMKLLTPQGLISFRDGDSSSSVHALHFILNDWEIQVSPSFQNTLFNSNFALLECSSLGPHS